MGKLGIEEIVAALLVAAMDLTVVTYFSSSHEAQKLVLRTDFDWDEMMRKEEVSRLEATRRDL